jgi:hypothetical protein
MSARWREYACARRATFDQTRIDFEAARRLFSSRRIEARLSGVARSARLDRAKVLTAATCLTNAAEGRGFMMHARIAVLGAAGEASLRKARIRPRRKTFVGANRGRL